MKFQENWNNQFLWMSIIWEPLKMRRGLEQTIFTPRLQKWVALAKKYKILKSYCYFIPIPSFSPEQVNNFARKCAVFNSSKWYQIMLKKTVLTRRIGKEANLCSIYNFPQDVGGVHWIIGKSIDLAGFVSLSKIWKSW